MPPIASTAEGPAVVETFHSLQGEGLHAGRSAFFIRLAGCDVACPWCDTKHSWPVAAHPRRPLAELSAETAAAAAAGAAFVVVTGGEPLQQPLAGLCAALDAATAPCPGGPLPLHLETSGVGPFRGRFDWITLSPKPQRPPADDLLARCDELKVVVSGAEDLAFAEAMAAAAAGLRPAGAAGPLQLLQPAWDQPAAQELAIAYVRRHSAWRLSLQSHKWLGVR